jgi:hypothetical protein
MVLVVQMHTVGGWAKSTVRDTRVAAAAPAVAHVFDGVAQALDSITHAAHVASTIVQQGDLLGCCTHGCTPLPAGGSRYAAAATGAGLCTYSARHTGQLAVVKTGARPAAALLQAGCLYTIAMPEQGQ